MSSWPTIGISIKKTAAYLRRLFGLPHTVIGGEILRTGAHDSPVFRLRFNGKRLSNRMEHDGRETVDQLIIDGAYRILREVAPNEIASYFYDQLGRYLNNSERYRLYRERLYDSTRYPGPGETDAEWAVRDLMVRGSIFFLETEYRAAISQYKRALHINCNNSAAYVNWGRALWQMGDFDGGYTEIQKGNQH